MSISPVTQIGETASAPGGGNARAAQVSISEVPARKAPPELGTEPKQEVHDPRNGSQSSELSQDEVQVQQNNGDGTIIIRYLDGSGNLILQIPSSQVLGLARAIEQALQEQAKDRLIARSAAGEGEGGSTHGH